MCYNLNLNKKANYCRETLEDIPGMHVQYMVRLVSNVMTFPVFIQGHVSAFLHCGIGLVDI